MSALNPGVIITVGLLVVVVALLYLARDDLRGP